MSSRSPITAISTSIVAGAILACTTISCLQSPPVSTSKDAQIQQTNSSPIESSPHICDISRLERDVAFFASDDLAGRGLGSAGLQTAQNYIAERFRLLGLKPAYPDKSSSGKHADYFQEFTAHGYPATANVIGILPGTENASSQAIVIGAHIDHLGTDPQLTGDQIFNGAEDNASGVAALLEIARLLTNWRVDLKNTPNSLKDNPTADPLALRTIIFAVFSAEEVGLLGSQHYVRNPVTPASATLAMINLDSVGRLRDDQLYVFGTGSAQEMPSILDGLSQAYNFNLITQSSGIGASDQNSFLTTEIPAIHFFTGPHEDYHKVSDEIDKVNFAGLERVTNYASELARYLAYRHRPLTYVPGSKQQQIKIEKMNKKGNRKVSIGFMPDFAMESGGVKVGPVFPGGPAAEVGIQTGDIIVAIDNEVVDSLIDYSTILRDHAPGDTISLTIKRGAESLPLKVVLQERK